MDFRPNYCNHNHEIELLRSWFVVMAYGQKFKKGHNGCQLLALFQYSFAVFVLLFIELTNLHLFFLFCVCYSQGAVNLQQLVATTM